MGRQANKLKVEECHEIILKEFSKFKEKRPIFEIPLKNFLMSSFAVFALKSPSLLQFENQFKDEKIKMHSESSSWDVFKENYTIFNSKYTFYGES